MASFVEIFCYDLPLTQPLRLKNSVLTHRSGLIIKLADSEDVLGYGDIAPLPGFSPEDLDTAQKAIIALDRGSQEGSAPAGKPLISTVTTPSVFFGFRCASAALIRAREKAAGAMDNIIHDTPALTHARKRVSVNGLITGTLDEAVAKADALRARGYCAAKLKVGHQELGRDIDTVREVSRILGDGIALRLDANRAWDMDTAAAFSQGIEGIAIDYIEEPLADPRRLREFVAATGMPVALDESMTSPTRSPGFLKRKQWVKAVVLKPTLLGGITETAALAAEALEYGLKPVVSACFESGIGIAALAHLAAEITTEDIPVGLDTYEWLAKDVLRKRFEIRNGALDLDEVDACVATIDTDVLERVYCG